MNFTKNRTCSFINDQRARDDKIQILTRRILDSVIINLQGYGCILSLTPPFDAPKSPIKGKTTEQACKVVRFDAVPDGEYFSFSGEAIARGICSYTGDEGEKKADCVITLPFECLLRLPEPSALKPEISLLASFDFEAAEALSPDCYCASASGVAIAALCSFVPLTVNASTYPPQNAEARVSSSDKRAPLALFPR